MSKVNILLSTYNGEKYIGEQMDSLLSQSYPDIRIYARDDGSLDRTREILEKYQEENPDKIVVVQDDQNLGYPDCFWKLLEDCGDADYYAFCDQDDVWMPGKIESAVKMLDGETEPALYIHDYELCDENLQSFATHRAGDIQKKPGTQLLFYTAAQGFSMVINDKLRRLMLRQKPREKRLPHDGWCIWNAFYQGKILCDGRVSACYRRHESAVTSSGMKKHSMVRSWIKKEIFGNEMPLLEKRARYFLHCAGGHMTEREKYDWMVLAKGERGIKNYFKRLFFPKRLRPGLGGELALRILFLLGK